MRLGQALLSTTGGVMSTMAALGHVCVVVDRCMVKGGRVIKW